MTTETRVLCVLCSTPSNPRRSTPGYLTCNRCADRLREALREIVTLYAALDDDEARLPVVAPGARRGPGFGSRSPARDQAIVLTDPRTTWTRETPIHNPFVVVGSWARMVREDAGETPPADKTISGDVALLIRRLDFITRQAWVEDLWREVREVVASLRDFHGDHKPVPVGRCPEARPDTTRCDTPLYAPTTGDTIRCRGCDKPWPRREWLALGQRMTTPEGGSAA